MLEAINLDCVRGDRILFRDVNFSLRPGAFLQVQGANGSGKTSLLRILCGLVAPANGKVQWQGANIRSLGEEYFTAVTYIGHRSAVKGELTCVENHRVNNGLAGVELRRHEAVESLQQMGLSGRENLPARLLSEGQRRRLALSRLLTCATPLWILDEVLTSLDRDAVTLVTSIIENHLRDGGMAVVATHQELDVTAGSFQRLHLTS
ncbi:MAG TPA: cytochrome c biogenesis heme-transporting ATPase CcmA [Pyrinomonadaceae bacterium]|nr:cytochrome c biogenesis heme-transporting ATPase CcmA [Pyrinomonadaceae bacterium]